MFTPLDYLTLHFSKNQRIGVGGQSWQDRRC